MIVVCSNCSTRLQVDNPKASSRPFNVRCPKCNNLVNTGSSNPLAEQGALAIGGSPSTERTRYEHPSTAPTFPSSTPEPATKSSGEEAIRLLMQLLSQGDSKLTDALPTDGLWKKRKTLLCASDKFRERVARRLADEGYQVHVAEDTRQAIETMRANQLDVVLLEPEFDTAEQGAAFVVRDINVLRPSQRRRLFFVLLSSSLRTMDAHSAFLNNANAVVNIADLDELPRILEVALREYNELYREFNAAFNLSAV